MMWLAQASSNIALIKYMGKKNPDSNLPNNASLSYTLGNLLSTVKLSIIPGNVDIWEPLLMPGTEGFDLSLGAQQRFITHLARLKKQFTYEGSFLIQSSNNFPIGTGLASSASSFAALTKCALLALSELTQTSLPSIEDQAQWSRLGSGSSCRSFYSPWALWAGQKVQAIELPYQQLLHQVILVSHQEKKVSSSEAHQRVQTSPYYLHRAERAEENLKGLIETLTLKDWSSAYHICWREFQDMHRLFNTCQQAFSYINAQSHEILVKIQEEWDRRGDGPLVTMDAGPNVHLLYRPDQVEWAQRFKVDYLLGNYDVL